MYQRFVSSKIAKVTWSLDSSDNEKSMIAIREKAIGEIVAEDYRTAQVFENYHIDYCSNGNRSMVEVCEEERINLDTLVNDIVHVQQPNRTNQIDYISWPLDLLTDYIEKKHHRYVEQKIPLLKQYLTQICEVHGKQHPELFLIAEHFNASAEELTIHMKKEELVLFPFIRRMVKAKITHRYNMDSSVGLLKKPLQARIHEHAKEGERFRHMASLSENFTSPTDGSNTYRLTFAMLKEFEIDLHLHMHLENNILFPKAVELEKELMAA